MSQREQAYKRYVREVDEAGAKLNELLNVLDEEDAEAENL